VSANCCPGSDLPHDWNRVSGPDGTYSNCRRCDAYSTPWDDGPGRVDWQVNP
jgi:hypothetical protein